MPCTQYRVGDLPADVLNRTFAVELALRAMVDRLETIEDGTTWLQDGSYAHGVVETAAALIQDVGNKGSDLGYIAATLGKYVGDITFPTPLSSDQFERMYEGILEEHLGIVLVYPEE